MDRYRIAPGAITLAFVLGGLGAALPAGKDSPGGAGIPPERVADYVHAVLEADRTIYTTYIVNRLQEKGIVAAAEHWEQDNALPLPAQFLQHSGRLVAEKGRGIRYRLIGLSPIYQRNAPATDFERKALETPGISRTARSEAWCPAARNNTSRPSIRTAPCRRPASRATTTIR